MDEENVKALLKGIVVCQQDLKGLLMEVETLIAPEDVQISELKAEIVALESRKKEKLDAPWRDGKSLNQVVDETQLAIDQNKAEAIKQWPEKGGKITVDDNTFTRNRRRHFVPVLPKEKELLSFLLSMEKPPFTPDYDEGALCDMVETGLLPLGLGVVENKYFLQMKGKK